MSNHSEPHNENVVSNKISSDEKNAGGVYDDPYQQNISGMNSGSHPDQRQSIQPNMLSKDNSKRTSLNNSSENLQSIDTPNIRQNPSTRKDHDRLKDEMNIPDININFLNKN